MKDHYSVPAGSLYLSGRARPHFGLNMLCQQHAWASAPCCCAPRRLLPMRHTRCAHRALFRLGQVLATLDMGGLPLLARLSKPLILQLLHLEGVFQPPAASMDSTAPAQPAFFLWAFEFDRWALRVAHAVCVARQMGPALGYHTYSCLGSSTMIVWGWIPRGTSCVACNAQTSVWVAHIPGMNKHVRSHPRIVGGLPLDPAPASPQLCGPVRPCCRPPSHALHPNSNLQVLHAVVCGLLLNGTATG